MAFCSLQFVVLIAFCLTIAAQAFYIDEENGIIDDTGTPEYEPYPDDDDILIIEGDIEVDGHRNAVPNGTYTWPNGVIPYSIDNRFPESEKQKILDAIEELQLDVNGHHGSCIQFVQRTTEVNYVSVVPKNNTCSSKIGRSTTPEAQNLNLGKGCMAKGIIIHELIHALGFYHEQSRADRNEYVHVNFDNVEDGHEHNFHMYNDTRNLSQAYDYDSIMHYNAYAFAINISKPTITPTKKHIKDVKHKLGQRFTTSESDVLKIQSLYNCSSDVTHIVQKMTTESDWCTFQNGLCHFENDPSVPSNWTVQSGPSDSGPKADRSLGIGKYAMVKAGSNNNTQARLLTRFFKDDVLCVNVFLYNYRQKGALKIRSKTDISDSFRTMKTYFGQKSPKWYQAIVSVTKAPTVTWYQLAFEASPGERDIAIDDLFIYPGQC